MLYYCSFLTGRPSSLLQRHGLTGRRLGVWAGPLTDGGPGGAQQSSAHLLHQGKPRSLRIWTESVGIEYGAVAARSLRSRILRRECHLD